MHRFSAPRILLASIVGLSATSLLVFTADALAQSTPAAGFAPNAGAAGTLNGGNEIIEVEGIYQGAVGQLMKLTRDDDAEVFVQLPSDPLQIHFRAKPDPQIITPGLIVRFQADFGPNGLPTAPVARVEIIRPINAPGMSQAAKAQLTPGVHPLNRQPGNPRQQVFIPGPHRIVGMLRNVGQGMMVVAAGNTPVQAPLAEDVEFVIDFNTLELAQAGDKVKVKGFYQPPDDTKIRAETVEMSTDRVMGEAEAKPRRRGRRGRRQKETEPPAAAETEAGEEIEEADDPFAPPK